MQAGVASQRSHYACVLQVNSSPEGMYLLKKYSNIDAGGPEKPLIYFVWPYIFGILIHFGYHTFPGLLESSHKFTVWDLNQAVGLQ